ncbi:unnamed protein product [Closterium sp. Naga37s-1]|nr:unnamed protein product [Closterium sp. Naga37s-1]
MPRQPRKGAPPVTKVTVNDARESAAKGHHSEPATPKPLLKEVGGPFADETRISLVKKLNALKFPSPEKLSAEGVDRAEEEKENENADEVMPPTDASSVPAEEVDEDEEEDDGYLSDDPEERFDPVKAGEIAARAGFSITLLIPIKYEEEVERTIDTVKGLLALWRKYMSAHVLTTTKCQVLLPAWLSKKRYGRLQVTFQQASDANYAWCRRIEHKMLNGGGIYLVWQHPENPVYILERATHPDSIEVLLKSVPAAITPEMVYEYLVKTVLEKRGRTPFLSGSAFHRVVDPVTGADTDKIKGLVKGHPGDKYRWWHLLIDSVTFRLVAMYLPAQACTRGTFFRSCLPQFVQAQPASAHLVVMGDLNLVEDPDLDRTSQSGSGKENQRLLSFWRTADLRDVFRVLHPSKLEYTFRDRATGASTRIDRGLVSFSLIGLLAEAKHTKIPKGLSDHWFAVKFALAAAAPVDQGPGLWRMQAKQAQRRGVSIVTANILKKLEREEGVDLGKKLKLLSVGLKEYSREERRRVRATVSHLERVVEFLRHKVMRHPGDRRAQNKLLCKEAHLDAYLRSCKDRMQVLAGIRVELNGEVPSPYLSAKIKLRKKRTVIREVSHRGTAYQGTKEVLKAAADHFKSAFRNVLPEEEVDWGVFAEGAAFSDAEAALLGADWLEAEVKEALESLRKGKSPGQDGLPAEYFILHWDMLKEHVMGFVNNFARTGEMPESLSTSVTVLLHKKGATDQLGNYRPITLLSVMYKLITKVMASRLKKVLGKVLSKEQHGFLPRKSLADAVSVVADAVEAANSGNEDWLLLLVDFQKAYDTVSRPFLFRVMKELGVPEKFISWTMGLHAEAGTKIIINGWLSERVEINRGVRQGCPLAPYLFLCALEPLCRATQRKELGIGPPGHAPLSYVGYADDTSFLLSGEEQLRKAVEVLEIYGKQSGLKVNCDKSGVVPLGRNRGVPVPAGIPYKWYEREEPERLLGVWITPSGVADPSWRKAYERIKEELRKWEAQYLTTTARVAVISCYVLPVLMFQAQVYSPPEDLWEKIRKLCHAFVSAGEAVEEKIFILWSAYLACLPRKDGGLGQLDPKLCLDGLAIRRIGKLLGEPEGTRRWLAEKAAGFPQGWATLFAHPSAGKHWQEGSERWKAAVKVFWKSPLSSSPAPANRWEVEEEFICFNKNIMHRGDSPFGHQLGTAALLTTRVRDLLTNDAGGRRCLKEEVFLMIELGSKEAAVMARKAYGAMPPEWKRMVEEPVSAEEVVAASGVVRYILQGQPTKVPWAVKGVVASKVVASAMSLNEDGRWGEGWISSRTESAAHTVGGRKP